MRQIRRSIYIYKVSSRIRTFRGVKGFSLVCISDGINTYLVRFRNKIKYDDNIIGILILLLTLCVLVVLMIRDNERLVFARF